MPPFPFGLFQIISTFVIVYGLGGLVLQLAARYCLKFTPGYWNAAKALFFVHLFTGLAGGVSAALTLLILPIDSFGGTVVAIILVIEYFAIGVSMYGISLDYPSDVTITFKKAAILHAVTTAAMLVIVPLAVFLPRLI